MKTVRCAIYTRKSSDEGLEQVFNSLDAQREACAAYILSQASEGWTALPAIYDDGGLSGGTLARPALQRLLADVAAGQIDIIVVYKVDRLTRSLFDFAKLVEALDTAGTSFVSVTQSFNTTTSMGRLTLNMLLSFAQFEREVTAERIRDKIAASKARGMWMGGTPPLGYAPDNRTLRTVDTEAELVRHLFGRYLKLGSVRLLENELRAGGVTLPVRTRLNAGQTFGGGFFSRGQLYAILRNPVYIGRIAHGDRSYAGLHPAMIDPDTWEQTQWKLTEHRQGDRRAPRATNPSLLAGRMVDADGVPLIASHANKAGRRYRYYVSRDLHHGDATSGLRIPAREIERLVLDTMADLLRDPLQLASTAGLATTPHTLGELHRRCADVAPTKLVDSALTQVRVDDDQVTLACSAQAIADLLCTKLEDDAPPEVLIRLDARLTRSGRVLRLVHAGRPTAEHVNPSLVGLLVQAHRWWAELRKGELEIKALAKREGVTGSYLTRVLRLAFLSPSLTQAILAGRQPVGLSARTLTLGGPVHGGWTEQARSYGA